MIAERAARLRPIGAAVRKGLACWWWLLRAYVADTHLMPRDEALEPPPARWLEGWPRGRP
ncbi:hypothetical protein [Phenylobacterium sp.]|uniref:hypothetical protein n=1 Tax=Phenylobacterium sp. TaxID=1871053 RepID=UPI003569E505